LCLLTNPNRDLLPAFKCTDRLLSAYTGYSRDLIEICRNQLINAGKILFIKNYYIFCEQDFVKPSTGRDSSKIYEREWSKLPQEIREAVSKLHQESTGSCTGTSTGTSTGYINIDINKDINITKNIDKETQEYKMASLLAELHNANLKGLGRKEKTYTDKLLKAWSTDIEKLNRIDGYSWDIIEAVIKWCQKDNFWKTNIASGSTLRRQFDKLALQAKQSYDDKPKVTVI